MIERASTTSKGRMVVRSWWQASWQFGVSAAPFAGVCRGVAGVRLAVAFRDLKPLRAMDEVGHSAGVRFTAKRCHLATFGRADTKGDRHRTQSFAFTSLVGSKLRRVQEKYRNS